MEEDAILTADMAVLVQVISPYTKLVNHNSLGSIALVAAGSSAEQLSPVLETYRELLNSDRDLLVPIIGSISEV
eukprot:453886-Hanusia_phi.AAC.5